MGGQIGGEAARGRGQDDVLLWRMSSPGFSAKVSHFELTCAAQEAFIRQRASKTKTQALCGLLEVKTESQVG